jgi:hypothetical protein
MDVRLAAVLALFVTLLAACARPPEPSPEVITRTPAEVDPTEPSVGESPLSPPATPTPKPPAETSPLVEPSPVPSESGAAKANKVMEIARSHLAASLSIPPEEVDRVSIQRAEWPDASLGCPSPGELYAQVVTPGYRVILEVEGETYELHTDEAGETIRICEEKREPAVDAAVDYAASQLNIPAGAFDVVSVQTWEWPDASLGCPEPGKSYAQVVTPGYQVILEAEGQRYEVHTDERGRTTVLCEPNG